MPPILGIDPIYFSFVIYAYVFLALSKSLLMLGLLLLMAGLGFSLDLAG